jgi:hypothetical protein
VQYFFILLWILSLIIIYVRWRYYKRWWFYTFCFNLFFFNVSWLDVFLCIAALAKAFRCVGLISMLTLPGLLLFGMRLHITILAQTLGSMQFIFVLTCPSIRGPPLLLIAVLTKTLGSHRSVSMFTCISHRRAPVLLVTVHTHSLGGDCPIFVWTRPGSFTY